MEPTPLIIRVRDEGDPIAVVLDGAIDLETAPMLAAELDRLGWQRPVVLDLRRVTFIDSTGLSSLIGASQRLTAAGVGPLGLRSVSEAVRRLLELTRVESVFAFET